MSDPFDDIPPQPLGPDDPGFEGPNAGAARPRGGPPDPIVRHEQIRHRSVTALVPDAVAEGVFATGLIVQTGPHEVVLDFILGLSRPPRLVARVVLPHAVIPSVLAAMQQNVAKHRDRFGPISPTDEPRTHRPPADVPGHRAEGGFPPPPAPGAIGEAGQGSRSDTGERGSTGGQPSEPSMDADPVADPTSAPPRDGPPVRDVYEELKMTEDVAAGAYANGLLISHGPTEFCLDFVGHFFPKAVVSRRVFVAAGAMPRLIESLDGSQQNRQRRRLGP